jgi:hypothetical protein
MKTGSDVVRSGLYSTECCLAETGFEKRQTFTRCPKCLGLTVWTSVRLAAAEGKPKKAA